jgi:transcriptional regulator
VLIPFKRENCQSFKSLLVYISIQSVVISKQEQIQQRRTKVWELYSRGMTQDEIAEYLKENNYPPISRRQIGYDIEWLRKDAANFVRENRKNIAQEYKKAMSNLEQLRVEAWRQFSQINDKESSIKVALYDKIQSLTNNIMTLLATGDTIELEMIKTAQEEAETFREEMDKIIEQRIKRQAIF